VTCRRSFAQPRSFANHAPRLPRVARSQPTSAMRRSSGSACKLEGDVLGVREALYGGTRNTFSAVSALDHRLSAAVSSLAGECPSDRRCRRTDLPLTVKTEVRQPTTILSRQQPLQLPDAALVHDPASRVRPPSEMYQFLSRGFRFDPPCKGASVRDRRTARDDRHGAHLFDYISNILCEYSRAGRTSQRSHYSVVHTREQQKPAIHASCFGRVWSPAAPHSVSLASPAAIAAGTAVGGERKLSATGSSVNAATIEIATAIKW